VTVADDWMHVLDLVAQLDAALDILARTGDTAAPLARWHLGPVAVDVAARIRALNAPGQLTLPT